MNIHRNPLYNGNFEYYFENPLPTVHLAGAPVRGVQINSVLAMEMGVLNRAQMEQAAKHILKLILKLD